MAEVRQRFTRRDSNEKDTAAIEAWRKELEELGHLFRYRSLRGEGFSRIYDIVARSELFFPTYPELNDPFDGRVWPTTDGTDAEKRAHMVDFFTGAGQALDAAAEEQIAAFLALTPDEQRERILTAHREGTANMGVVCFSATGTDIPMWAYYADSHRGVCLRFRGQLLLGLEGCSPPIKVEYKDSYPAVSFFRGSRFERGVALTDTKASAWTHEKEWRIVRHAGRGPAAFNPAALDGIILGCGISGSDEARLKDLCARARPDLELLKTRPADREFLLDTISA